MYQLAGRHGSMYTLVANDGRGLAITGQREWADYRVSAIIRPHMAEEVGLAGHVQGLERYYALLLQADGQLRLLKRGPGSSGATEEQVLAERAEPWDLDRPYRFALQFGAGTITARLNERQAFSVTDAYQPLSAGAIGLLVTAGRADVDEVSIY